MGRPSITLHPRAVPGDRLQVWIGAFDYVTPPILSWTLAVLGETPRVANPSAIRPLDSVRSVERRWVNPSEPRAFSGVYEFEGDLIQPDRRYLVEVRTEGGETDQIEIRSLPLAIPEGPDNWFNILLVSCFHWSHDKRGIAGASVRRLPLQYQPHMSLLLGDQVYLDLPPFVPFRSDEAWLAKRFEEDYKRNWTEEASYRSVFRIAPSVSIPDDHEYWNNFPHAATIVRTTWTEGGREKWKAAASRTYEAFQLPALPLPAELAVGEVSGYKLGDPVVLTVPPVSVFVLDSRSYRTSDKKRSIKPATLKVLNMWAHYVQENDYYGVIATGQSYLEKAADWRGRFADYTLLNYEDIEQQITAILSLVWDTAQPMVLITGDVHWGRIAAARAGRSGPRLIYEVISSPTSLVWDPRSKAGAGWRVFKGLFGGEQDPWPEHGDPKVPPLEFGLSTQPGRRLQCETLHPQKGNQFAILSFQRLGLGLRMRIAFWPVHLDFMGAGPAAQERFVLKRELLPR